VNTLQGEVLLPPPLLSLQVIHNCQPPLCVINSHYLSVSASHILSLGVDRCGAARRRGKLEAIVTNNWKKILLPVIMLTGASAVTFVLYLNRPPSEISEPVYVPVTIDVAVVAKETIRIPIQAQGTVSALRQTSLISEVKGRIVEVSSEFNVGGYIAKDEIILRIDPRNYQTQLLQAQAAVESANSNLAQEKGRSQVAAQEWKKLPSGSQRSQAAKDLYLRKPQLQQTQAQALAAAADLNTARDNLERTIIRAPYDALISKKNSELGQFVGQGSALAEIVSVDYAEVRLAVPQSKLAYIELPALGAKNAVGSPVDLYTDISGEISHWSARIHRTEGVYDERSRVLFTVARIADPYALINTGKKPLRLGTFVNANIQGRQLPDLVALPRYILRAGNFIWVVDENLQLRNRKLQILRTGGETMYVTAGLENGDLVSLTALDSNFSGATVEIISRVPSNVRKPDSTDHEALSAAAADKTSDTLSRAESSATASEVDPG
jgi:RND family efflux transporter MFP subunit